MTGLRFKVTIDLGNEAMSTATDVAGALLKVAVDIVDAQGDQPFTPRDAVRVGIRDENGNTVGDWEVLAFLNTRAGS